MSLSIYQIPPILNLTAKVVCFLTLVLWFGSANVSYAQLNIDGAGADERPFSLALPKIEGDAITQSGTLQSLLIDDFLLSGAIKPNNTDAIVDINQPVIKDWQSRAADFLLIAQIKNIDASFRRDIRVRIFDVARGNELEGVQVAYDSRQTAIVAHQIADIVIERITGNKIGLSQLIAFVVHNKDGYEVRVSDILGKNSHSLIRSRNPITSPTWSPDGSRIAYSSFEEGPAKIFIQEIASGKRISINTNFESATAPSWSFDGKNIAFSAYSRGRTSLFEYNLDTSQTRTLVDDGAINTEPSYDNKGNLYYASGRGRSPQIYRLNLANLQSERISFDDDYCTRPSVAIVQPIVVYLCQQGRKATVNNLNKKNITNINMPTLADGVSISPKGRLLLLSVAKGRNFNIIITNINGSFVKNVDIGEYNYYEPSWRP